MVRGFGRVEERDPVDITNYHVNTHVILHPGIYSQ